MKHFRTALADIKPTIVSHVMNDTKHLVCDWKGAQASFERLVKSLQLFSIGGEFEWLKAPSRELANAIRTAGEVGSVESQLPCKTDSSTWPVQHVNFNPSQIQAVKLAMTYNFALIQGPPGTGKTSVAIGIADEWCVPGHKCMPILLTSNSQTAVDNLCRHS